MGLPAFGDNPVVISQTIFHCFSADVIFLILFHLSCLKAASVNPVVMAAAKSNFSAASTLVQRSAAHQVLLNLQLVSIGACVKSVNYSPNRETGDLLFKSVGSSASHC